MRSQKSKGRPGIVPLDTCAVDLRPSELKPSQTYSTKNTKTFGKREPGPISSQNSGRKTPAMALQGKQHRRIKSNIVETVFKKMGTKPSTQKIPTDASVKDDSPEQKLQEYSDLDLRGRTEGNESGRPRLDTESRIDELKNEDLSSSHADGKLTPEKETSETQIIKNIKCLNKIFLDSKFSSPPIGSVNIYSNYQSANPTPHSRQPKIPYFDKKAIMSKIEHINKQPPMEIEVAPAAQKLVQANKRSLEATPTNLQRQWKVNQLFESSRVKNAKPGQKDKKHSMHEKPADKGPTKQLENRIKSMNTMNRLSFRESPSKERVPNRTSIKGSFPNEEERPNPRKSPEKLRKTSRLGIQTDKEKSSSEAAKKCHKKNVLSVQISDSTKNMITSMKLPLTFGNKFSSMTPDLSMKNSPTKREEQQIRLPGDRRDQKRAKGTNESTPHLPVDQSRSTSTENIHGYLSKKIGGTPTNAKAPDRWSNNESRKSQPHNSIQARGFTSGPKTANTSNSHAYKKGSTANPSESSLKSKNNPHKKSDADLKASQVPVSAQNSIPSTTPQNQSKPLSCKGNATLRKQLNPNPRMSHGQLQKPSDVEIKIQVFSSKPAAAKKPKEEEPVPVRRKPKPAPTEEQPTVEKRKASPLKEPSAEPREGPEKFEADDSTRRLTTEEEAKSMTVASPVVQEQPRNRKASMVAKIADYFKEPASVFSTNMEFYNMTSLVGEGSFGKVYSAVSVLTGEKVAIKCLDKAKINQRSAKQKVQKEIDIHKRLVHPNIARFFEVFHNEKYIFMVMEFAENGDLFGQIRQSGVLSEGQSKEIIAQIVSGLEACHSQQILHRDIKLDNILLGASGEAKICDFGVSLVMEEGRLAKDQLGTPAYMAPELLHGKGYSGFGSDIWNLGVTLYIMLTGKIPFNSEDIGELQSIILEGRFEFPEEPELSAEVKDLISSILVVDPQARIKLPEIKKHRWFGPGTFEKLYTEYSLWEQPWDHKKILAEIESYGFPSFHIDITMKDQSFNHIYACYVMLSLKAKRERAKPAL